jgi:hypothetical protein
MNHLQSAGVVINYDVRFAIVRLGDLVQVRQGLVLLSQAFGARLKRLSAAEQQELKTLLEKMI